MNRGQEMAIGQEKTSPIVYGQALKNRACPYCNDFLTKGTTTKEHLLPRGLTGKRPYDFLVCKRCNNKKSKWDDNVVNIARMGAWSPHLQAGFERTSRSEEGQKSLVAFLKHVNLSSKRPRPDGNWTVEMDDMPTIACIEWLKYVARGAYFLETGFCLRPKEKLRAGGYFIRPTFLTSRDIGRLSTREERQLPRNLLDPEFQHPQLQTFGEGSVRFLCESIRTGMMVLLGREYLLGATVVPYKKKDFLKSINEQLSYLNYLHPNIQGKRAGNVRNGTLIFH